MSEEAHDPRRPGCPEPAELAAHAEHRLVRADAARMDEHIAGCRDCYEEFSETLQFRLADGGADARKGVLVAFVRRPAFRIAAGFAAAAAAIVVALTTHTYMFPRPHTSHTYARPTRPAVPLVAELAQAMSARRLIEPRLTGGFEYARLIVLRSGDTPKGLDAQPPAVLAAVARIRERAENDPSPEALGALGITYLISGDLSAAVKALESASAQDPKSARLLSDLSAAYLARATQADEPADVPKALEAAEKAIALPNPPVEAWFNRALALEALPLVDAARKAWEDYLSRDSSSDWAGEARQHLERLAKMRQSSVEEDKARARAAVEEGPAAIERLADEDPQVLRNYLEEDVLPAWADAVLVGHPDAALHRARARLMGEALLRTTGDAMPRDAARALAEPPATAVSRDPLRSQALGYRALREANRLYADAPSCSPYGEAIRDLDAGDSPYAAWARRQNALACRHSSEPDAALAELGGLESLAESRGYVLLLGRVRWIQALIHGTRGELTLSLELYRSALAGVRQSRDSESEAILLALLAENFQVLGESRSVWRYRLQAFERLADVRAYRLRHGMLSEAIFACLDERMPRTALHLTNAQVEMSTRWASPYAVSETLQRRAVIHHILGADELAASDLRVARLGISRITEKSWAERLEAEADAAEGEILVRQQPETAARALEASLAYFRGTAPVRLPALHLLRARAQAFRGLDAEAEEELVAGIKAMEDQRVSQGDAALRVSFFDQSLGLFDEMVGLQVVKRRDPERALAFVERSLARELADSLAGAAVAPLEPEALRRELPDGLALVYYLPLEDRLYAWALSRQGSHFIERSLPAAELSRLVAAHRVAIETRASLVVVRRTGARLLDELVRPLIPFISPQRALIFIPSGILQSAAFASLWNPQTGRYLVEDYVLGVAPSGTVFIRALSRATWPSGSGPRALVVGNPRIDLRVWAGMPELPEAEAEAADVAGLYAHHELLTGSEATKAAFARRVRASQVVHFAGHAIASTTASSNSRLLLAPGPRKGDSGALYLHELERSRLPHSRVVVLAACRTAEGAVSRVEGPLSLGRPFLAAGVPDVVASLWDIDDAVSRRFFVGFHRALLSEGDPVLALRKVQIAFLRSDEALLSHPASWAAFICMGGLDPRSLSKGVRHECFIVGSVHRSVRIGRRRKR